MKWRRLGQIFDPRSHALPAGCLEYAQSPQALVFPDFVRIFYSTRPPADERGQFVSHVAFVDIERDSWRVIRVSSESVIPLGTLGCFDEHGIFPLNVLRVGELVYGYIGGWSRRVSVPVETAIGLAISKDDGVTFQRVGDGPLVSASLNEPFLVGDPFVKQFAGTFHMWYIFGKAWKRHESTGQPERVYKIGHALSADGLNWSSGEGRQLVPDRLGADECQALPAVVSVNGRYLMVFCYRQAVDFRRTPGRGYQLGHAWSDDLRHWTRDDTTPFFEADPGDWDGEMQCYPHVFEDQGSVYLLYNGNAFGRYGFGLARLEQ